MENVRRRKKFRLVNTEEKLITLASRPEFMESVIFTEDLVGVCLAKDKIVLHKPIYIGQAVLEPVQVGNVRVEVQCSTPL